VREEPDEPFHLYNLGIALDRLGLQQEAETALRRSIELAPRHALWTAPAFASLAHAVAGQGRSDEAVKLCKAATKRDPEWAQGWCRLGAALVDAGRQKAALRAYTRALDCVSETWRAGGDHDDTVWQGRAGMGKIHLAREEYREAAACLDGAVTLNPGNAEMRVLLARAYEALGRSGDARRHLEEALAVGRSGAGAYVEVADFFTRKAEATLVRGLADNAESRMLLEQLERLRSAQTT
jgi:Flp pilus assembly protein TadD